MIHLYKDVLNDFPMYYRGIVLWQILHYQGKLSPSAAPSLFRIQLFFLLTWIAKSTAAPPPTNLETIIGISIVLSTLAINPK